MPDHYAAPPAVPQMNRRLLLIFAVVMVLLTVMAIGLYVRHEVGAIKDRARMTLAASAELKSRQLGHWYADELNDAALIAHNRSLLDAFHSWHNHPSPSAQVALSQTLHEISLEHDYSEIFFFNVLADVSISVSGGHLYLDGILKSIIHDAARENKPSTIGLYYCPQHEKVHMDIAVPIALSGLEHEHAMVFRFEPEAILFPILSEANTPDAVIQTMLLDMLIDSVLVVSNPENDEAHVLRPRTLSGREDGVLGLAALGNRGLVEYQDSNGRSYLGWISKVPNCHWVVISQIDKGKLYADMYEETALLSVLAIVLFSALFLCVGFLFTQRQRDTYRQLLHVHKEFRSILYAIGDAVISTDRDGVILHMNPEAERLTGVTERAVVGTELKHVYKLESEESGEEVRCAVERALKHTDSRDLKNGVLLRTPTGEHIPILESVGAYSTEDGRTAGVVIVFRDQTVQRERQRVVEESERKYRALFEATADGIVLYAARGTAGAASTERVGDERVIFDILDANDSYRSMNLHDDVLASARIRPSDNEHGDELIRLCSLVMQDGSPRGGEYIDIITQRQYLVTVYTPRRGQVALLLHDITELKSSENALLEKIRELERFNRLTIDRELRMIELKKEINVLLRELGRDEGYTVHA